MDVLDSHVNPADPTFHANRERMQRLVAELREREAVVRQGGGPRYVERHREQGKLPVRDVAKRMGVSVATLYRHAGKRGAGEKTGSQRSAQPLARRNSRIDHNVGTPKRMMTRRTL